MYTEKSGPRRAYKSTTCPMPTQSVQLRSRDVAPQPDIPQHCLAAQYPDGADHVPCEAAHVRRERVARARGGGALEVGPDKVREPPRVQREGGEEKCAGDERAGARIRANKENVEDDAREEEDGREEAVGAQPRDDRAEAEEDGRELWAG